MYLAPIPSTTTTPEMVAFWITPLYPHLARLGQYDL